MISKAADYAARALCAMSLLEAERYVGVRPLADELQVSRTYLAKILQDLVIAGLLNSRTGPGGGFSLARDGSRISIYEVIQAVDGEPALATECVLGLEHCADNNPCPVHATWKPCRENLLRALRKTTLDVASARSWPKFMRGLKKALESG